MTAKVHKLPTKLPSAKFEVIDPPTARKMLATNHHNRAISRSRVEQYAYSIIGGEWKLTGQPIQVDTNGNLLDGQHRLEAVIAADEPITQLVVRGLEPGIFDVIDCGKPRSAADTLTVAREYTPKVAAMMAGAARLGMRYDDGGSFLHDSGHNIKGNINQKVRAWIEANELFRICGSICEDWIGMENRKKPMGDSVLLFHLYAQSKINPDKAERFMRRVYTAFGCTTDDPEYKLRARLVEAKMGYYDLNKATVHAIIVKTWNFVHGGSQDCNYLLWSRRDDAPKYRSNVG